MELQLVAPLELSFLEASRISVRRCRAGSYHLGRKQGSGRCLFSLLEKLSNANISANKLGTMGSSIPLITVDVTPKKCGKASY